MPFDLGYPAHTFAYSEPGLKGCSLQKFFSIFPTNDDCLQHVFHRRFGEHPRCARCSRVGRWHKLPGKRFIQHSCGQGISPLAGTLMHKSSIPAHLWFYAMLHFANSSESVSAIFLRRQLGVGHLASMRIADRIRVHMAAIDENVTLGSDSGIVLARLEILRRIRTSGSRRNYTQVLALGDGRKVLSIVVPYPQRYRILAALADKLSPDARLVTDCPATLRAFTPIPNGRPFPQFAPSGLCGIPDTAKGFIARFRHALACQHMSIREEYLWKYLKEYEFRYNRRFNSENIFPDMIAQFPSLTDERLSALERRNSIAPPRNKTPMSAMAGSRR